MNSLHYQNTRLDWLSANNHWKRNLVAVALLNLHRWNMCRMERQQNLVYPKHIQSDEQKKDYKVFIQKYKEMRR